MTHVDATQPHEASPPEERLERLEASYRAALQRIAELLARGGRYWSLLRRQQLVESIEGDEGEEDEGNRPDDGGEALAAGGPGSRIPA